MDELEKKFSSQASKTEKKFLTFFIWSSIVPIILVFTAWYYTTANLLQNETTARQVAFIQQKNAEISLFVEKMKAETASLGMDGRIRDMASKINSSCLNIKDIALCPPSTELSDYIIGNKTPLDPSVYLIDILSVDGIVVASSEKKRIGIDLSEQKNSFREGLSLPYGSATFFPEIVANPEELGGRAMVHLTSPIYSASKSDIVGVLLAHSGNAGLDKVVSENTGRTTESYIVNNSKILVTPSRFIQNAEFSQVANTYPVRECVEHGISVSGKWQDYRGVAVFGASVCDPRLFGTLIVETDESEVLAEITRLRNTGLAIFIVLLILLSLYAYLSGANIVRGVKHILPSKLSSIVTIIIVVGIIIISTIGISYVFTNSIRNFIIDQKFSIISTLVAQQAERHINHSEVSAFLNPESADSQAKFRDFSYEVTHSFQSASAVQLHSISGVLIWSSLPNADIGKSPEAAEVAETINTGKIVRTNASRETISELGKTTITGMYMPILGAGNNAVGVAEVYVDTDDIAVFTQRLQTVLWVGALVALFLVFLLLRYVLRAQDAEIIASSALLVGVIEESPIGIFTILKDGTIETYNRAIARESGIQDTNKITGANIFDGDFLKSTELYNLIRKGLQGNTFEEEIETPASEDISKKTYHHYYGVPLKNKDGEVERLLLMSEDVTKRKVLEKEVAEYSRGIEGEYRATLAGLDKSAIVSITDNLGNITYANEKFVEVSKYSKEELIGQNHRILKSGDQPEELFSELWSSISSGKTWRGEIKDRAKDGSFYWIDSTIVPILDYNGEPKNYVSIQILITERKMAEERLRTYMREMEESKIKSEALLASLGEGMIATDNNGQITAMNQAAKRILGLDSRDAIGKKMTDVIIAVDENNFRTAAEQITIPPIAEGMPETQNNKMYFLRKSGSSIPVAVTATPVIIDGYNAGSVVIFRDITAENEVEKTRRDLLSLASHQLRTPLSGTKWLIETLKRRIHGPLTKNQEEYLGELYKINERMTTLVHDMLGVLRMEGDISKSKKEEVSIHTIIGVILETLGATAKNKGIAIRMEKSDESSLFTDPLLLRSILENLISNAINYSPSGSEVLISVTRDNNDMVFGIKDNGIGIPRDEQRQIFERFYRASNAKTYDTHGTGLGLYVSNTLAKKIGARISFESEKDKGSTFFLSVPVNGTNIL